MEVPTPKAQQDQQNFEDPILVAEEQADDPELWLEPGTESEAILQRALRRLHAAVEGVPWPVN